MVNIEEIADTTEFIYDLESCVLALHRRAPFTGTRTIARVWRRLLGVPYDPSQPNDLDIHTACLKDSAFSDKLFDTDEPLIEARITYAKPNPGSGDDALREIHLGLLG